MNTGWKPKSSLAILYGVIFQPFVFLYVNRLNIFWVYLLLSLITTLIDYFTQSKFAVNYIFLIACPLHAYVITRNYDSNKIRKWYSNWWAVPGIFIVFFVSIYLFRSFLYEPFSIPASSMSPNIDKGDFILVKKWGYGDYGSFDITMADTEIANPSNIRRGELYVFYEPKAGKPYVKRLVGLPGDTIQIDKNNVIVNGHLLTNELVFEADNVQIYREKLDEESYLIQRITSKFPIKSDKTTVPNSHYYFLGDNRNNSSDSRYWGTVSSSDFIGKVVYVYKRQTSE